MDYETFNSTFIIMIGTGSTDVVSILNDLQ